MKARAVPAMLMLVCAATACTPVLDWREVRPEGAGLVTLFPCKPAGYARRVPLAGMTVEMSLSACSAGAVTYAVGYVDIGQPQLVARALDELIAAAARNIGATRAQASTPLFVEGMTPNPQAGRQAFAGQLSDGLRVEERVAVFVRGTRVYQATVVGARLDVEAVETFFGALRLPT